MIAKSIWSGIWTLQQQRQSVFELDLNTAASACMRVDLLVHSKKTNNPTADRKVAHASNNETRTEISLQDHKSTEYELKHSEQQTSPPARYEDAIWALFSVRRYPKRDAPNVQRQEIQKKNSGDLTTKKTVRHPHAKNIKQRTWIIAVSLWSENQKEQQETRITYLVRRREGGWGRRRGEEKTWDLGGH